MSAPDINCGGREGDGDEVEEYDGELDKVVD